jgi:tRNA(adenine34) deaminase
MRLALEQAAVAGRQGEVPVGAVVVLDDRVIGRGANSPIRLSDPTAHAEVLALRDAAARMENYRLVGVTLYCTVEPCLMCLGAALHARVERVVFGTTDPKVGATAQLEELRRHGAGFNHRFETVGGVLADEAAAQLTRFFVERRDRADTESQKID